MAARYKVHGYALVPVVADVIATTSDEALKNSESIKPEAWSQNGVPLLSEEFPEEPAVVVTHADLVALVRVEKVKAKSG